MQGEPEAGDARDRAAADWFARMRGPEAEASRADFEKWRAVPENAEAYEAVERTWTLTAMGRWTETGRGRDLRRPFLNRPLARIAIAASFVLALLAIASLVMGRERITGIGEAITVASRIGEIRDVTLDDGSQVTLDADTQIVVALGNERRITLLGGRARFTVAHDTARPFIVTAAGRSVIARGTVFDVARAGDYLSVTLLQGSVDVVGVASGQRHDATRLKPGFALRDRFPDKMLIAPATAMSGEWVAGKLAYEAEQLGTIVADANRYSRQKIVLANPDLSARRVSGVFDARQPGLAGKIAAALDLPMRDTGRMIILG